MCLLCGLLCLLFSYLWVIKCRFFFFRTSSSALFTCKFVFCIFCVMFLKGDLKMMSG